MKHPSPDVDALIVASEALEVPLSSSQADRLLRFERLLVDRAIPMGMIARSDRTRLRERHVLDCLRAAAEVGDAVSAYDLGSGAGLPGLVIAVAEPDLRVGLVESRRSRVSFLELAVEALGLTNVEVRAGRVQELSELVDLCFARAFAPLAAAWSAADPLLSARGRLVYFAGNETPSVPTPAARILAVRTSPVLESAGLLVIMGRQ
ncbi:MAG TPA: RsmG family class I SAM-dependent methyltransferase [Actinomycetota bacterium]|nr:RsmG family class I SAM-dependent methyltransferase [Actinomycetota bacterium]